MTKQLLTPPQVAELLGVPERTLDQWAWLRTGPAFVKIGRYRRYRPDDIEAFLKARIVATTTAVAR
jgi:excisionase family DNA binding protein